MKIAICLITLFISTAPLQAMDGDAMEIDNGSPREPQEHVKSVLFRAITTSSPIAQSQSLAAKNNDASTTKRTESCSQELSWSTPCRETDRIELDLSALAIGDDAMDDN
jgi:hypothetical protein